MKYLIVTALCGLLATYVSCMGLREEFTWTRISYEWPSAGASRGSTTTTTKASTGHRGGRGWGSYSRRSDAIAFPGTTNGGDTSTNGPPSNVEYTYENNIPMGANVWKDKLFVTVPRRRLGVPSSLNYVRINSTQRHNVPLIPYPDWETNLLENSGRNGPKFVSVYRVAIDPCDRMWFIDTGVIETLGNPTQVQPSALVIMDLNTDQIIQRHVFNSSVVPAGVSLANLVVDTSEEDRCRDAYAYIPDLVDFKMVVYSLRENRSWRVTHNYFYMEPLEGEFSIGGHRFQWNDGVFSVALSDVKADGFKDAYFHSMAGVNLYKVSTRVLRNETLATRSYHGSDFELVGNRGPSSQTSASASHPSRGILFLGLVNQNALGCWHINSPLDDISLVQKDDRKMIYPSDVKVRENDVIVLTNTMPVFLYGTLDYDTINFRVWMENVDRAVEGTRCGSRRGGGSGKY